MLLPLGVTHVEIVSVLDPDVVRARAGRDDTDRERNLLESYHADVAEDLRTHTGLDVETKVLAGPAAATIIDEAEATRPDYLVISTHGASGLSRWRLGSVADKVIRGASRPTLVVGPKAAERVESLAATLMPRFKSILLPLDGSALAEGALPYGRRFLEAFGGQLHLVTVASINAMGTDVAWAGVSAQLDENLAREARAYLEQAAAKAEGMGSATLAVRFGSPAEALSEYVADNAIDLVIMTSHGRGGLLRSALGSTTDRMLGGAAPVLVIRGEDGQH
jgi:nucleotide-binding universal stress UspA family protein